MVDFRKTKTRKQWFCLVVGQINFMATGLEMQSGLKKWF